MDINSAKALIPVRAVVQPLIRKSGITCLNDQNRPRDRIFLAEYKTKRVNNAYGPSGKTHESHSMIGGTVDIYV